MKLSRVGLTGRFVAVVLALSSVAVFAPSQAIAANCKAAQKATADAELLASVPGAITPDEATALREVFPWGAPQPAAPDSSERLLYQRDYIINYDTDLLGPVWAADWFSKPLPGGRIDCFRTDPRVDLLTPAASAAPSDFDEPIFDQGHVVPNGDMTFSETAILNTFMMSNMSPQFCQFNRGVWQILEEFVRRWSEDKKPLYAFSGAVFDRNGDGVRDPDDAAVRMRSRNGKTRVAIPSAYYKVLAYRRADGALETLTILLPHDQTDVDKQEAYDYLEDRVVSIATVEALAGLKFFPDFADQRVEAEDLWSIGDFKYRSLVAAPCRKTAGAFITVPPPSVYQLP